MSETTIPEDFGFFTECLRTALPSDMDLDLASWARKHCLTPGSPFGESFDVRHTPWMTEVLRSLDDRSVRETLLIAPVQSGKSQVSEVFLSRAIATNVKGDIMLAFETDDKAGQRWRLGLRSRLLQCDEVKRVWPLGDKKRDAICNTNFDTFNFRVNGVKSKNNLSTFTFPIIVLDECHNYEDGKIAMAKGRAAGVANHRILYVSTGSNTTHELHSVWKASTQREFMWRCPSCGNYHVPRFRIDKANGSGLHYDLANSRNPDNSVNFVKLRDSVYYQFPCCKHAVRDDPEARRLLAMNGKYSDPVPGSSSRKVGFRVPGLVVTAPVWAELVLEKINGLEAMRHGDITKFITYVTEREADFFDNRRHNQEARDTDKPAKAKADAKAVLKGPLVTPEVVHRLMTVDAQAGTNMVNHHYYYVIRDLARSSSTVVAEGRAETEEDLVGLVAKYNVFAPVTEEGEDPLPNVLIDGQWNTEVIYRMAERNNWLIVRGSPEKIYRVNGKPSSGQVYKRYDEGYEHRSETTGQSCFVDTIWHDTNVSKERLYQLKTGTSYNWIIPDDVSPVFKEHNAAWDRVEKTGEGATRYEYTKISDRVDDDLGMCEVYQALWLAHLREHSDDFSLDVAVK